MSISPVIDPKNACSTCGKMVGVFTCRGCLENFCVRHTTDHRAKLGRSMDEVVHEYDALSKRAKGVKIEENQQILIKQVDQWEHESIEKVRHLAQEIRQQLSLTVDERSDQLKYKLAELKQQLDQAHQDGGFYENDLRNWFATLDRLRALIDGHRELHIDNGAGSIPFISRISINGAFFDSQSTHELRQHPPSDEPPFYRHPQDRGEFFSGNHTVAFKLVEYDSANPALFGIVSKTHPTRSQDPNKNPSFYGWTDKSRVYKAGELDRDHREYRSDFQQDDIVELGLDCHQQRITFRNERTKRSSVIYVQPDKCPLPWQLNVRLLDRPE